MHFTSFLENGRLTVALDGEIDHHCAKQYILAIGAKIEAFTPEVCILDFQEVSFVDSSGIAVVIKAIALAVDFLPAGGQCTIGEVILAALPAGDQSAVIIKGKFFIQRSTC